MSDDLIKRLREIRWRADLMHEAADCIEQLEREMDEMQDRLDAANKARADAMSLAATKQAKLAKVVGALREIERHSEHANYILVSFARAALADLEKPNE